jgi:hypothetical protein
MNSWTTSNFFEKPYDWREQLSAYKELKSAYDVKKATYDAYCKEKLAQISSIKFRTTLKTIKCTLNKSGLKDSERGLPNAEPQSTLFSPSPRPTSSPNSRKQSRLPFSTFPPLTKKTPAMWIHKHRVEEKKRSQSLRHYISPEFGTQNRCPMTKNRLITPPPPFTYKKNPHENAPQTDKRTHRHHWKNNNRKHLPNTHETHVRKHNTPFKPD